MVLDKTHCSVKTGLTLLAVNFMDTLLTIIGFYNGINEGNPIGKLGLWNMFAIKFALVGIVWLVVPNRMVKLVNWLLLGVCIYNLIVLILWNSI